MFYYKCCAQNVCLEELLLGNINVEGKQYLSKVTYFADLFNFFLHDGENIIKLEELRELDTTEIAIPYGNDARVPIQKYRDVLKCWAAMQDDSEVYVMLGAEIQSKAHYAMPVKNGLYDLIGYANQVEESRKSYRKKDKAESGNIAVDDGTIKIKMTSEEFLSGFRKSDKLIPIITLTVFLFDKEWDGPLNLQDMLDVKDERLREFLPNCPINLIAPSMIKDEDFSKFTTDLGLALNVIKHQSDRSVGKVLQSADNAEIDSDICE